MPHVAASSKNGLACPTHESIPLDESERENQQPRGPEPEIRVCCRDLEKTGDVVTVMVLENLGIDAMSTEV